MNANWIYDNESGRYLIKNARILFPNFEGAEQDYNQAGKRNFRLQLPEDLAMELKDQGVFVRERPPREDDDEQQYLLKVGIYRDADIRFLQGRKMNQLDFEDLGLVDTEFRKGHVANGDISVEFHISRNTRVAASSPYVRVDTMIVPIRKSKLLAEYEDYDDELPM